MCEALLNCPIGSATQIKIHGYIVCGNGSKKEFPRHSGYQSCTRVEAVDSRLAKPRRAEELLQWTLQEGDRLIPSDQAE